MLAAIADMREDFRTYKADENSYRDKIESRLRTLEDWKLSFMTKLTIYSAVAIFLGSIISQVGISILMNYIEK